MGKIEFSLKRTPNSLDIPLASLRTAPLDGRDVIRIEDYSEYISSNIVDINSIITSTVDTVLNTNDIKYSVLNMTTPDIDILVTDKTYFDEKKVEYFPLWYKHTLSSAYYNKSFTTKTIKRRVRADYIESDRVFTYLTDGDNKIIVDGSLNVSVCYFANGTQIPLDKNVYDLDYTSKKLTISSDYMYIWIEGKGTSDSVRTETPVFEIIVSYDILSLDILVTPIDVSAKYIVQVYRPILSISDYFVLELYSNLPTPFHIIYKYADSANHISEMEEYTLSIPVYTFIENDSFYSVLSNMKSYDLRDKCFTLSEIVDPAFVGVNYNIHISESNSYKTYYITNNRDKISKLRVNLPRSTKYSDHWFLTLTPAKIAKYDSLGNKCTFSYLTNGVYKTITEKATIVGGNLIALSHKDPLVSRSVTGKYSGITVTRNGVSVDILYIDKNKGLVCLEDDVSRKESIYVSYSIKQTGTEIQDICFNPTEGHKYHNGNVKKNVYAICAIPTEYAGGEKTIYIKEFPKYENGRTITYTYDKLNEIINSSAAATRNPVRLAMGIPLKTKDNKIVDFYSESILYRIEILALVYLTNPLDEDGFEINDVRTYGGGYIVPKYSCYDYSLYDGEMIDLSAKLQYSIPKWIYSDLRERALEYDETIAHLSDKEARVDSIVSSKILGVLRKYSQPGTDISYEVVE